MVWFNRKVLVVDNESMIRSLIASTIQLDGFDVMTAGSAAEALDLTKLFRPDLVVLDLKLGFGLNGVELALKLQRKFSKLTFVFLTHSPESEIASLDTKEALKNYLYLDKSSLVNGGAISQILASVKQPFAA